MYFYFRYVFVRKIGVHPAVVKEKITDPGVEGAIVVFMGIQYCVHIVQITVFNQRGVWVTVSRSVHYVHFTTTHAELNHKPSVRCSPSCCHPLLCRVRCYLAMTYAIRRGGVLHCFHLPYSSNREKLTFSSGCVLRIDHSDDEVSGLTTALKYLMREIA